MIKTYYCIIQNVRTNEMQLFLSRHKYSLQYSNIKSALTIQWYCSIRRSKGIFCNASELDWNSFKVIFVLYLTFRGVFFTLDYWYKLIKSLKRKYNISNLNSWTELKELDRGSWTTCYRFNSSYHWLKSWVTDTI